MNFIKHILALPLHWRIWVGLLFATNMVAVFFLDHVEAWAVLAALMLGGMSQMYIFAKKGFVRLLGLGHVYWIPLLLWLFSHLQVIQADSRMFQWVVVLAVMNGLSLLVDAIDVIRYAMGDRKAQIVLA